MFQSKTCVQSEFCGRQSKNLPLSLAQKREPVALTCRVHATLHSQDSWQFSPQPWHSSHLAHSIPHKHWGWLKALAVSSYHELETLYRAHGGGKLGQLPILLNFKLLTYVWLIKLAIVQILLQSQGHYHDCENCCYNHQFLY